VKRQVESIPDIVPGYIPSHDQLASFFYLLGTYVDWEPTTISTAADKDINPSELEHDRLRKRQLRNEQKCVMQVCQVIAFYYSLLPVALTPISGSSNPASASTSLTEEAKEQMEHVLFPLIKRYYLPSSSHTLPFPHTTDNHVQMLMELTSLEQLYKVFERC
jgi:hypothetical protein